MSIFTQADHDQNGVLDEREFKLLLDTSELDLNDKDRKSVV